MERIAILEVVANLMLMAGAFLILVGGSRAYEAYTSQFWPVTQGEIVSSRMETYASSANSREYRAIIRYGYWVEEDGEDPQGFEGDRITIDPLPRTDNRAEVDASLARFPKGMAVDVYYNPNRPFRSVLEPSFSTNRLIRPIIGLIIFAVAFGMRLVARRNRKG